MDASNLKDYLLSKPEAIEDYPFGPDAAVYKVMGKVFALVWHEESGKTDSKSRINLKCDPIEAVELRDVFDEVTPGYHMNKKHWNTVRLDGGLPATEIQRMIDNSYRLVVKGLKKSERQGLEIRAGMSII